MIAVGGSDHPAVPGAWGPDKLGRSTGQGREMEGRGGQGAVTANHCHSPHSREVEGTRGPASQPTWSPGRKRRARGAAALTPAGARSGSVSAYRIVTGVIPLTLAIVLWNLLVRQLLSPTAHIRGITSRSSVTQPGSRGQAWCPGAGARGARTISGLLRPLAWPPSVGLQAGL